jgi:hypothetical protein
MITPIKLFAVLAAIMFAIALGLIVTNAIERKQVSFPDAVNEVAHQCTLNVQEAYYYDYRVSCTVLISPGNLTYPACIDLKDSTLTGVHLCYTNPIINCRQPIQCNHRFMSTFNYIYCNGKDDQYTTYYMNYKEPNTYEFGCICPDNPQDFLCTMEIIKYSQKVSYVSYDDVRYTFYHSPVSYNEYNGTQITCYDESDILNFDFQYIACKTTIQQGHYDRMMIWVYVVIAVVSLCAIVVFAYGLYNWKQQPYDLIQ